jgi:RES domain-containing protein
LQIYRIAYRKYAGTPLNGEGSFQVGGRWSSPRTRMAYTSMTATLAILEFRAHVDTMSFDPASPPPLVVVTAEIDAADVMPLEATGAVLPPDWRDVPAPVELAVIGDAWIDGAMSVGLVVPSVVLPDVLPERNVLINPLHPRFGGVTWRIDDFAYDPRLLI